MEDLVFVVSVDGIFTDYLQPWDRKDLYLPPNEFLGKHIDYVLPENLAKLMQSAVKLMETSGQKQQFDYVLEFNGEKSWYDAMVSPIRDREGTVREALFVARNITERKKMADKVMELYEHEKRLRQELETEISKRIEFTRLLVHELKTPITPILSSSELMLEELKDNALLGLAENINRGALNLNRRIDELLDLAKSEIGTLQINPKKLEPTSLIKEISETVIPVASRKHQYLILELPASLPVIWADEDRLRQVVLNLLQNAFKFTPIGGKIVMRATAVRKDLVIEVEDNGRGISEQELSDIFEPYRQKKSIRARLSGLGLGLALSRRLIELHGGNIWVQSKKGKGSTFGFSIPVTSEENNKTSSNTVGNA
jgi:signal transduction histidine kinase